MPDGLCEMKGTVQIAAFLLMNSFVIPYKYIVESPKAAEDNDSFECLNHYNVVVNRALVLSPEQYNTHYGG